MADDDAGTRQRNPIGSPSSDAAPEQGAASDDGSTDAILIALIEDNRLVREGITALLNDVPGLRVAGGAGSSDLSLLRRTRPHVVLLDLGLQNGDSLQVAEEVAREFPESRVIVMDLLPVHEDIMEFVRLGVKGFIMKDATLDELVHTIRSVADGFQVLPAQMTTSLFSQIAMVAVANGRTTESADAVRMTPREQQVIHLISEGLGNRQIAGRLHISIHTVKSHVRNIMEKLALHTRLQIAAFAHRARDD